MSFVVNNSYLYNRCATWTLYNQVLSHRISGGQHQKFQSPIRPMLHVFDIGGPSNPLTPPNLGQADATLVHAEMEPI